MTGVVAEYEPIADPHQRTFDGQDAALLEEHQREIDGALRVGGLHVGADGRQPIDQGAHGVHELDAWHRRPHGGSHEQRWQHLVQPSDVAEHLVCDDDRFADGVRAAGSIFIGSYTAQVAGDYAIGSNHVLPTNGAARFRGGLHAADFVRVSTVQRMTRQGLKTLAPTITTLAREEGLEAHARSIEVRLGRPARRRGPL